MALSSGSTVTAKTEPSIVEIEKSLAALQELAHGCADFSDTVRNALIGHGRLKAAKADSPVPSPAGAITRIANGIEEIRQTLVLVQQDLFELKKVS